MLENEFKYYVDHHKELYEKHPEKFLVIKNDAVIGVFDTQLNAYTETIKTEPLGTFLIQQCTPGTQSYIHTFHSRVFI